MFTQTNEEKKKEREKEKEWREKKAELDKAVFDGDNEKINNLIFYFTGEPTIANLNVILEVFSKVKDVTTYWTIVSILSQRDDTYDDKARKKYFEGIVDYILKNKNKNGNDLMYVFYWQQDDRLLPYVKRIFGKGSTGQKVFALEILKKFLGKKFLKTLINLRFRKYKIIPTDEDRHTVYVAIRKLITEITNGIEYETYDLWMDFLKDKKSFKKLGKKRDILGPAILKEEGKFSTIAQGARKILVISGTYDPQLAGALQDMGISYELKGSLNLLDKKTLQSVDVIFIGCGASLPYDEPTLASTDKKTSKKESVSTLLRNFVSEGGYIFTEDLGIEIVEKLFPGYISKGESQTIGEYQIYPNIGFSTHPLLFDVFTEPPAGGTSALKWKLEMAPVYPIQYDESKVEPLIFAPTFGSNNILGVTFFYPGRAGQGKFFRNNGYENIFFSKGGRVLHLLGHFGKQQKETGGIALQQLVLNFVYEARLRQKKNIFLPDKRKIK